MPRQAFGPWVGLDLRGTLDARSPKQLNAAVNMDMLTDGSFCERDGLRQVATVDANSVGLYSVGGRLRAALAAGWSKPSSVQGTVPILYDFVGDGTVYPLASVTRVSGVSSWDADSATGIYPAIVIQRSTGAYEIHWIKDVPIPDVNGAPPPSYTPSNDPVSTKIPLPFSPGETILKIQEKVCAIDNTNGAVWFCSTVNGLLDWTALGDAGFLPVIKHATGDRTIQGLSFYDSLMAVMFTDSIQLWRMHPDPALHELVRVLDGPGVQYPGSVANVRGDLIYFSRGTFSSLKQSSITGQLRDGDIGAPIYPATKDQQSIRPIGLWSQSRSAYYCFLGTEVWRYMVSPNSKTSGWTSYTLPVSVSDAVEHLGELYVRSGTGIYRFEAGYADGSTYTFETGPLDNMNPGDLVFISSMDVSCNGTPAVKLIPDMRDRTAVDHLFTLDGSTASLVDNAVLENSEAPAFRFTGLVGANGAARKFLIRRFVLSYTRAQK